MAPDVRAVADISSIVGNYYDKLMLERLVANAVLYKLADKRPIPKGISNVINMNRFTNFPTTTTKLTEGIVPTQTYLSGTAVTATLYQLAAWTAISDVLELTSFSRVIQEAVANFGDSAATSVDTRIMYDLMSESEDETPADDSQHMSTWFGALQGGLSSVYISANLTTLTNALAMSLFSADVTASAGHYPDLDKVRVIVRKLRAANCRPYSDGYYRCVAHPDFMMQIERTGEWQEFNKYTRPEVLDKGFVGKAEGVKFYESTIMYQTNTAPLSSASTSLSLSFALIWGQGAWACAELNTDRGVKTYTKAPNKFDTSNPVNQWSTIGWKILMAGKKLNGNCGYFLSAIVA
jgi:N4-gp56 family major capsid protein